MICKYLFLIYDKQHRLRVLLLFNDIPSSYNYIAEAKVPRIILLKKK